MRILCVWCKELTYGTSYEQMHYFSTLQKLGHEVFVFPIQPTHQSDVRLLDTIEYIKPEMVLFKLYRTEIARETIEYITNCTDVTTVGIFGDDEKYFYRTKKMLDKDYTVYTYDYAPSFNYTVTMNRPAVRMHKNIGVKNVIYSPYGANSYMYKKKRIKRSLDVSFCGSYTDERRKVCNAIAISDIKMKVYGNGWKEEDLILEPNEYVNLFNMTKINVNVSVDVVDKKRILQIKGRDFEVPMCGGFLLTHANPLLDEFYKVGKEIETYKTNGEMVNKIKYYLKYDDKREKIALAGYKRARACHTYKKRFQNIMSQIHLKDLC